MALEGGGAPACRARWVFTSFRGLYTPPPSVNFKEGPDRRSSTAPAQSSHSGGAALYDHRCREGARGGGSPCCVDQEDRREESQRGSPLNLHVGWRLRATCRWKGPASLLHPITSSRNLGIRDGNRRRARLDGRESEGPGGLLGREEGGASGTSLDPVPWEEWGRTRHHHPVVDDTHGG